MSAQTNNSGKTPPAHLGRLVQWGGLAVLLVGLIVLGFMLVRLAWTAWAVKSDLDAVQALVQSDLQQADLQEVATLVDTMHTDLVALRRAAHPFLWLTDYLGWLPGYGADLKAAPTLLDIAIDLTTAADTLIEPLLPLASGTLGQQNADPNARVSEGLRVLGNARPQLTAALAYVRTAERSRQTLTPATLSPRLQKWMPRLDQGLELVGLGTRAGLLLPDLLGAEHPTTLLVLIQNEDELRATGGFISGVARITLREGAVQELVFEDSYAIDDFSYPYPDPPQPLLDYMLTELWLLRDSNWSPDWPTSAQAAIDLYTISRDAKIDGVLALNQRAISLLIDALGPLHVEGSPEPLTGENVISVARQTWGRGQEEGGDWWWHRKDFMATALQATVDRLEGEIDQETLYHLYQSIVRALDEKHLLVYLPQEDAAALVSELGWDGALRDDPGDYLMVIDTNMGFNKANALVTTELDYAIDLSDPALPLARLTVRHHHPLEARGTPCQHQPRYDETYAQMMERCYWDYLRVYAPFSSTLIDATPHDVPASALLTQRPSPAQVMVGPPERGRALFATLFLLRPSETLETRFEYTLPPEVLQVQGQQIEYKLLVQKQAGTYATPIHVQLRFSEGMTPVKSEPEPNSETPSTLEYDLTLRTDQSLRVVLRSVRGS